MSWSSDVFFYINTQKVFVSRLRNFGYFHMIELLLLYVSIHQIVEGNSKSGSNNINKNLEGEICVRLYGSYEW